MKTSKSSTCTSSSFNPHFQSQPATPTNSGVYRGGFCGFNPLPPKSMVGTGVQYTYVFMKVYIYKYTI